jgi:ElaB/YqjD/DUF883 family membrane-anchored ribosome-binding protein
MDEKLKEKIDNALKNGKVAIEDIQGIVKNITKEVMEKSKTQGEDLKQTSGELYKEIVDRMGKLGKSSYEFIKAASQGFMDGIKESNTDEKNLLKDTSQAIKESLKSFADAGVYVTKETAKNISAVIEGLFKKDSDQDKK